MTITINNQELVSALAGLVLGYVFKIQIQTTLSNIQSMLVNTLKPKS